jgi:hypothetical protein
VVALSVCDILTGEVRLKAEMCGTCIFRPGNLMRLRPGRVRQMVDACNADHGHIVCHDTLDRDTPGAICRGHADGPGAGNIMALRIGYAVGKVREV